MRRLVDRADRALRPGGARRRDRRASAVGIYDVGGVRTSLDRSAVAATGAAIVEADHGSVVVTASPSDLRRLRRPALQVTPRAAAGRAGLPSAGAPRRSRPPTAATTPTTSWPTRRPRSLAAHPSLVSRFRLGTSHEGRAIWALKVSDNVAPSTRPSRRSCSRTTSTRASTSPSRWRSTCSHELTTSYATDARIRTVVDTREIWIVPSVNPDGAEFDVATGSYVFWRKNRQPDAGSRRDRHRPQPQLGLSVGLLRRLERRLRLGDLPRRRRVLGARDPGACATSSCRAGSAACSRSRASIDFHTYGELVMWPFGYTIADTAPGHDADQQRAFATLGQCMARPTATRPSRRRTSTSPTARSTTGCGAPRASSPTRSRCTRRRSNPGFYPPDEVIAAQTSRNREAVLRLLEIADCPYRAIGKQAQYCAAPPRPPPPPPPGRPRRPPPAGRRRRAAGRSARDAAPARASACSPAVTCACACAARRPPASAATAP